MGNKGEIEIVAFGDSNTQGANWKIRQYPQQEKWVTLINTAYSGNLMIHNAGISGETTEDALKRFEKDVLSKKPDLVFIMFGTNDAAMLPSGLPRVDKTRFKRNLKYFTKEIRKIGAEPVLMTCLPVIEGSGTDTYYYSRYDRKWFEAGGGARQWHNAYNDLTREAAREEGAVLVDHWWNLIDLAGESSDEALLSSGLIDPSGNHLTPSGARELYNGIMASGVLQQFLQQSSE
ncbi:SGNH/GDSL hydrolase family protein [Bacillus lacus]|uniref:SGNH/GDSL hydrolase family protein n=2 Tax=Metabacillus lacus TaxID=1983721 RepID=A0A7X2LXJ1_9BACI|nr:SGNH/GDSL hydrolase family protein [Metabacillus lacus]MRX71346.1 SGNH/GDSL hydrolase family protein [Metabacillus lacus]